MAEENLDFDRSPAVINETVYAVKDYLDGELGKADYATSNRSIKGLFGGKKAYDTAKGMGVGQTTILKFLGGNWKQWMIQHLIKLLDEKALITLLRLFTGHRNKHKENQKKL